MRSGGRWYLPNTELLSLQRKFSVICIAPGLEVRVSGCPPGHHASLHLREKSRGCRRTKKRTAWQNPSCVFRSLKTSLGSAVRGPGRGSHPLQGAHWGRAVRLPAADRRKQPQGRCTLSLGNQPHPVSSLVIKRRIEQFGKMLLM